MMTSHARVVTSASPSPMAETRLQWRRRERREARKANAKESSNKKSLGGEGDNNHTNKQGPGANSASSSLPRRKATRPSPNRTSNSSNDRKGKGEDGAESASLLPRLVRSVSKRLGGGGGGAAHHDHHDHNKATLKTRGDSGPRVHVVLDLEGGAGGEGAGDERPGMERMGSHASGGSFGGANISPTPDRFNRFPSSYPEPEPASSGSRRSDQLRDSLRVKQAQLHTLFQNLERRMSDIASQMNTVADEEELVLPRTPALSRQGPGPVLQLPRLNLSATKGMVREESKEGAAEIDYVKDAQVFTAKLSLSASACCPTP